MRKPYTQLPNDEFDGLLPSELSVLVWLYRCRNRRTGKCCPSIRWLAKSCHMSKTTVMKAVDELVKKGRIGRKCTGIGYTAYYTLGSVPVQAPECTRIVPEVYQNVAPNQMNEPDEEPEPSSLLSSRVEVRRKLEERGLVRKKQGG